MQGQSIKKNYIYNTAYQILSYIMPLITTPYISRILGASGVGIYSYTTSIAAFFTMFACLGTTTYGQRVIAQNRDDDYLRSKSFCEIELLSILTTIIVIFFWVVFLLIYPEYKLYFLILSLELISNAFDITWFYAGLERFSYIVFRNTVIKILGVILIFAFVKSTNDLWIYILILSGTKLLGNMSMWVTLPKFIIKVPFTKLNIKPHIKETFIYFIPTAAASIYSYLDKVMLGVLTDSTLENGYYEQAQKIIRVGYTVVISLNTVMSSRLSYLFSHSANQEIIQKLEQALAIILTLGIPMVFGLSAVSFNFVPWFFGPGFERVRILLIVGSPLIVIMSLHNYLSAQYLIPSGQRARSTKGVFIGAGVNFMFNLILIPILGAMGALIASVLGEVSIMFVYMYMSKDFIPIKLYCKYLPKQIISSVIMLIIVLMIGWNKSGSIIVTIIQIIIGTLTYFLMMLILQESCTLSMIDMLKKQMFHKR